MANTESVTPPESTLKKQHTMAEPTRKTNSGTRKTRNAGNTRAGLDTQTISWQPPHHQHSVAQTRQAEDRENISVCMAGQQTEHLKWS
jgi:hypothetical protein